MDGASALSNLQSTTEEQRMCIYADNGYNSREDYLESLADEAGEDSWKVYVAAELLGPNEDFDGLITTLQDEGIEV